MKATIVLAGLVLGMVVGTAGSAANLSMANRDTFAAVAADQSNTFLGDWAGSSNTTGENNTFLGVDAGFSNTEGNNNTFSGYCAGYHNDEGNNNTFIGHAAGLFSVFGTSNTFCGAWAGSENFGGHNNTFVGMSAGSSNHNGNYNTCVGYGAGYSNTLGKENTFLGVDAGGNHSTGNSNTFLGYAAGMDNLSGDGNVFLGYQAGSKETGSSKLYIANSQGTPLIYGDFATGMVGLGLIDPTAALDINGSARLRNMPDSAGNVWDVQVDSKGRLLRATSSTRYKTDIETLAEDANKVLDLRPVQFRWQSTGEADVGLIAEEVAGVLDSLVIRDTEGRPDAVKYDKVPLYLLSVIQVQQQRIEAGEAENRSLAKRIEALEQTLRQVQGTARAAQ